MSFYYNDYIISSNNSMNDNKYNAAKLAKSSASYKIKKVLKPLLRMLKQSKRSSKHQCQHQKNSSLGDSEEEFWSSSDCNADNSANEALEEKILNDIQNCPADAAIYVYNEGETCDLHPVYRDDLYVPVHFARTQAGTFFWTTMQRAADSELCDAAQCSSDYQAPAMQYGDRWVQA